MTALRTCINATSSEAFMAVMFQVE